MLSIHVAWIAKRGLKAELSIIVIDIFYCRFQDVPYHENDNSYDDNQIYQSSFPFLYVEFLCEFPSADHSLSLKYYSQTWKPLVS